MRKIGFIGTYDKTDCMLNVAKILSAVGKKVLIVDSTIMQKARYIVPAINPTVSYITEFEEIDVAVGFYDMSSLYRYLGVQESKDPEYDFLLIDIDSKESIEGFGIDVKGKNYFVTGFDTYSLKKGLEILKDIKEPLNLTKILFSKEMSKEEDDYLNYLSMEYKVTWNDERVYFPIENGDASVIAENQRISKIRFKPLSVQYKDSMMYIAEELLGNASRGLIRRTVKNIEKGV